MMMLNPGESQPGMTELFEQLGLPSDPDSIARFIASHSPLPPDIDIEDAPFWTESQKQLLSQNLKCDAEWAIVADQLSAALRTPSSKG